VGGREREVDGTKKQRVRERKARLEETTWKEEGERKRDKENERKREREREREGESEGNKMRENKGKRKRKKGREKTDAARWVRTYYYTSLQSYL